MAVEDIQFDRSGLDLDAREERIRRQVYEAMESFSSPDLSDHIVATYYIQARTMSPEAVGKEISYHMTSGVRGPRAGSLLDQCTGVVIDSMNFDSTGHNGVVRVAFPLKMLRHEDGSLYTTDILHITAGEGIFGLTEHADIKLCDVAMSDETLCLFPGPAYGAEGVRKLTGFGPNEVAFGTILKPCTGITPDEEAGIIVEVAANPMFIFVKEDENFLPRIGFALLRERLKAARRAIDQTREGRGGKGLIFAPHISAPPQHIPAMVEMALEAGVNGVMLSDLFTGGTVRMVRELTRRLSSPPAIYGHNGGISCRTRHIYREVIDFFVRLDGADFRQTAPLSCTGESLLRPAGLEWRKCEEMLSRPAAGHPVVMMARAGGLDQGNIIQNLMDATQSGGISNYLFLAGSAINGIKDASGKYNPKVGALAMRQALEVFERGVYSSPGEITPTSLRAYAEGNGMAELSHALMQRYKM